MVVVFLYDERAAVIFSRVPPSCAVRFEIVRAWDAVHKYHYTGYVVDAKRPLTADELLYFRRLAAQTQADGAA